MVVGVPVLKKKIAVQLFFNSCAVFQKSTSKIDWCGCAVAVVWGTRLHSGG